MRRRYGGPAPRAGGTALLAFLLAAGGPGVLAGQDILPSEECVSCHLQLEDSVLATPALLFREQDVHAELGFGCLACHGGPRTGRGTLAPGEGFLSKPGRAEIPEMCGRCHSDAAFMRDFDPSIRVDQVAEYWSSVHGLRLRERDDPAVATCVDCHVAHGIRPASDLESPVNPLNVAGTCGTCHADPELMAGRDLPTDQLDEYLDGVHGRLLMEEGELSSPTCNDCHGNHGAAPPGLESVRNVCGECHVTMADFFAESDHVEPFDEASLPGCATCHDNHDVLSPTDDFLEARTRDVCLECHDEDDESGMAFLVMGGLIDSLLASRDSAEEVLLEAEDAGMEVSEARFRLEEVFNVYTRARTAVHAFRVEPVAEVVGEGLEITTWARAQGEEALDEHTFRRVGLGLSSAVIFLLVVAILLKIRELERAPPRAGAGAGGAPGVSGVTSDQGGVGHA